MSKVGKILNLGSSSQGNCFYIEVLSNGGKLGLLLESGFSYNEIVTRLSKNGVSVNDVDLALISHKHADHSMSIHDLLDRYIEVYAPKDVFDHYNITTLDDYIMQEYKWKEIADGVLVLPIPLEHFDKNEKVTNYGYIIKIDNEFRILFAIDTKYIPQDLSNFKFDLIFVEANYIEDTISWALKDAKRKQNHGKIARYERLLNSHMSVEALGRTFDGSIGENAKPYDLSKCKAIFLMHLSSNRATNDTYYQEFLKNYLNANKEIVKLNKDCKVYIAKRNGGF